MSAAAPLLHVVLVAPEIAANTGNIIRLCANTGATLHLVDPLGFELEDRRLRRAGLDYHELTGVRRHDHLDACLDALGVGRPAAATPGPRAPERRAFALSGRGGTRLDRVAWGIGDVAVFGAERAGLTTGQLDRFPAERQVAIPMRPANRSLNLANAVAVVLYEAWRQHGFDGAGGGTLAETPGAAPYG